MTEIIKYDVVVIGGGLAGMRAAIECLGCNVAIISKVHPVRSHSGAAQGGIAAALGNEAEDSPEKHAFDTVKGSDYLGDQDIIEKFCEEAPQNIYELEHMGCPFSRTPDGKIAQREFGGHSVPRACYAADLTGHVVLHALFEQIVKHKIKIYSEYFVLSLIIDGGICKGLVAYNIPTGELKIFHAKAVIFATGGYGRAYKITSNAHANTGDGLSIIYRAGLPLEDMEFVQFHPTGLYQHGILVTEGARGEGGYLINKDGERFMKKYAPQKMELAPRDLVSRSIQAEIDEGRGIDGKDYVYLDITHLGREKILEKLPQIHELVLDFSGVDSIKKPIPIQPTAHYSMGGIPTNINGEVVKDINNTPVPGLYAAGECACISLHGANRLGCNSLMDAVVFGKKAGKSASGFVSSASFETLPNNPTAFAEEKINKILNSKGDQSPAKIRKDLQESMLKYCGIFRDKERLEKCLANIKTAKEKFENIKIDDRGKIYNSDLIETIELGHILDFVEVIVAEALNRTESRGAHARTDFPKRDDENWLKHTLAFQEKDGPRFEYKSVSITKFKPMERKY